MLGPDVIDNCWRKNVWINKEGVSELTGLLEPIVRPKQSSPNYRQFTTETKLSITLYYLQNPGSLWITANTFGVNQSTVSKTVSEVCKAINEIMNPKYLYIPGTTEEMREIISKFEVRFRTTQAFGCTNGTNVPLKRPQNFLNYRQLLSLNVQSVCDSQGRFIDVACKWAGLVHDAKVFPNSTICKKLQPGKTNQTSLNLLPGYDTLPNYIIEDPTYPLTPY